MATQADSGQSERTPDASVTFGAIARRIVAVVQAIAVEDPDSSKPPLRLPPIAMEINLGPDRSPLSLDARFDNIVDQLELDPLERAVLAICVAPEIHPDFGRLFGYLYGAGEPREATPRIAGKVLAGDTVSEADVLICFDRAGALVSTGAIRLRGDGPLAERTAAVGGILVNRLLGARLADDTADARLVRIEPSPLPFGRREALQRLTGLAMHGTNLPVAVVGPDALLALTAITGRGALALDARAVADAEACADLSLAGLLEDRVPAIHHLGELPADQVRPIMERAAALTCRPVLCAADRRDAAAFAELTVHVVELQAPTATERAEAWRAATGIQDVEALSARFRLSLERISDAVRLAAAEGAGQGELGLEHLWAGARAASSSRLGELAERLAPGPTWDDLILPARQVTALHAMSSFLSHREGVLADWGYRRVARERGLTTLFAGESGTGKTLAAQVVAAAAQLDVFRVDLSSLFSKWVGETEKNLERIFVAAESANAVLFFDEADVVFGKRTESSDSSDRYANLETAFLLQRIERYEGVVVLATNLRSNMDDAFLRRLDLVVDFPPPDETTRRRLWDALLPEEAPRDDDVDLDFLAQRFDLSGGGIRNCSLAAALLAAEDGTAIAMRHLVRAVALEFAKLGRLTVEADFGSFHRVASGG